MPFPTPSFPSEFGKTEDMQVSKKEFAALYSQFQKFLAVSHDSNGNILNVDTILDVQDWTVIPYDAAMFSSTGGSTWSVPSTELIRFAYRLIGESMLVHLTIGSGSNITVGSATTLVVSLPSTFVSSETTASAGWYTDNVTPGFQTLLTDVSAGLNTITFRLPNATFPVTANLILYAQIEFQFGRIGV